ncbi:PPE domain-containing protein [Rhodococcus sp. AG1013]|uniref:PPE domain-containing protein n=1 Tax=unclassified Rhodococcus (in: high G+C Gram-positive bacteria) TaxID=192944 RepID=UPI000E0AED85|nr:PPE domain-containing protein [Rhodococcus sp. AG1013]RDI16247.1 PPE-repeat protein [Rhodococcus sp. AG1013]
MTTGVTGVVWMPRGATVNSTTLTAGAGPVPLSAASPAWAAVAESFADAGATLNRVMAELRTGWEGVAAEAALGRIAPFAAWAEQTATLAADTATKASVEAGAYTSAALTMPSLPEITAVKAAKTAAYSTGGVVNGSAAVAEAADRAMDIRAGLVMEAYEAASSILATPGSFTQPPPLTNESTAGLESRDAGEVARRRLENDFRTDPVGTIAAAATAFAQNPTVMAAASQVGTVAGTVSGATSAAANIGGAVLGGVAGGAPAVLNTSTAPTSGAAGAATAGGAGRGSGYTAARAAGVSGGAGGARAALPDGWAQAGQLDGSGSRSAPGTGAGPATGPGSIDAARADASAAAAARGTAMGGAPMGAHRGALASDEAEHATPGYLKQFEHFADGRTVIPSVIGADLPEDGR